ncbi:hypothetical protein D6D01_10368 [Aureobasidium pullulans]|uniref:HAT C-terminal dimerisation domain-containing protein n=1 Tax=Aureobasidium pullulans TaxID=5580 RepID=A0A4S9JGD8_AURPU|nr:hypothetical protein D6D01_10368 [Aureobasidium pullulans]
MANTDTFSDVLSSALNTSEIRVPTELQRTDDFRSIAPNPPEQDQADITYYSSVDWSALPHLEGTNNGKGASKSYIWKYGWRMQKKQAMPRKYFWVCTSCHKQRSHRTYNYNITNGTDSAISHLLEVHDIDREGPRLKRTRSIADQVSSQPASSRVSNSSYGQDIDRYGTVFNEAAWKGAITALIVHDNLAFRLLESPYMQQCLTMLNPAVESRGCLPSHSTLRRWISQVYNSHVGIITEQLRLATSSIHFSFDLWTSRNVKALCGINVHFADEYGNLKTFLLALPQQHGKHTGTNIAETIAEIISRFSLDQKIGFFVADNASNNDTCIAALAEEFSFDAQHRRLRCAGHIFNLVARALLWGVDEDAFLIALASVEVTEQELECWRRRGPIGKVRNTIVYIRASPQRNEEFKKAQREHPLLTKVVELHAMNDTRWNSVFDALRVFILVRPAVDDFYHKTQRDWQDYVNEKTDFGAKPCPEKMRKKPGILEDFITQDDWVMLTRYYEILEPVWQFTQRLEGRGTGASHGVVWQVIPAMERLFSHFEKLKDQYTIHEPEQPYSRVPLLTSNTPASQSTVVASHQSQSQSQDTQNIDLNEDLPVPRPMRKAVKTAKGRRAAASMAPPPPPPTPPPPPPSSLLLAPPALSQEHRMLATGVNLAWKKLDEYYQMTDQSPVYVAAVVLHPAYTWRWLRSKWKNRQDWLVTSERAVREFWTSYYSQIVVETMPADDDRATDATAWMDATLTSDEEDADIVTPETDEYARWCVEGRVPDVYHPLEFWSKPRIKHTYPRLSRMARDLFTIPAMSDEPERVFSSCGNMVTPQRGKLSGEAIEEAQCIKSWMRHGIITNLGATFELVAALPQEV